MRQNVTLSLDANTLALAKQLAAQRHPLISGLLAAKILLHDIERN